MELDGTGRTFATEDEEARHCLGALRDGGADEKRAARDRLGRIFERRGLVDEAAACYETNLAEGVRDPSLYRRLADVYRRQGRSDRAATLLASVPAADPRPDRAGDAAMRRASRTTAMPGASLPLRLGLGVLGCAVIVATLALLLADRPASPAASEAAPSASSDAATAPTTPIAIDPTPTTPNAEPRSSAVSGANEPAHRAAGLDGSGPGGQPAPASDATAGAASGRPELADAGYGPHDARPGSTLTLTYEIDNPATDAVGVVLAGAIRLGDGTWLADPGDERVVRVPPGRSIHTRHLRVPLHAPAGVYDVRLAIASVDRRVIHAERTEPVSLAVGTDRPAGEPDVPIPPAAPDDVPPSPAPAPAATPVPPEPNRPRPTTAPPSPTQPPATSTAALPTPTPAPSATPPSPTPPRPEPTPPSPPSGGQPSGGQPGRDQPGGSQPSRVQPARTTPLPDPSASSPPRSAPAPGASGTARPSAGVAGRAGGRGTRIDCPDFPNQAAAQAVLRADPSDPHHLDLDRDGIACEKNPPPRDVERVRR